ncbi:MAG: hypothetical protein J0I79_14865 [Mesorhizobium sp.]|uniref:hypothetical protein n=1 Tax=Mesorhizobium sp. TaxID=1871066 RepID=UPI001AC1EDF2|nr:hypothetical protein [Mesorhizobium sp.]MBN9219231.1 hypothetical protein [Mesorhizobium sp.]
MSAATKPIDHPVAEAAASMASTTRAKRGGAAVSALMKRFDLTTTQAVEAIRANALRLARAP